MKSGIICRLDPCTNWKNEFPEGTCYLVTNSASLAKQAVRAFRKQASHKVTVANLYPHVVMFEHEEDAVLWKLSY
jgi:hypothetical protein